MYSLVTGLSELAEATDAWVVTGGENRGMMKMIGEALLGNRRGGDRSRRIPCIGVCAWSRVLNTDVLLNGVGKRYEWRAPDLQDDTVPLDPNHTHFLLFDDGTAHSEPRLLPWLGRFLSCIERGGSFSPIE